MNKKILRDPTITPPLPAPEPSMSVRVLPHPGQRVKLPDLAIARIKTLQKVTIKMNLYIFSERMKIRYFFFNFFLYKYCEISLLFFNNRRMVSSESPRRRTHGFTGGLFAR